MQFANQKMNHSSILSPMAVPFTGPGSVSAFLQEQETCSCVPDISRNLENRQKDIDRLEALTSSITNYPVDDEAERALRTPSPQSLLSFHTPPQIGCIDLLTPAEFVWAPVSAYDRASEPVVRVTKAVWKAMGDDLSSLMEDKRQLEKRLTSLQSDHVAHFDEDHDVGVQLGKLRYQNEVDRDQRAVMGKSLAQKEIEMKKQQLDVDHLSKRIVELESEFGEAEWFRITSKKNEAGHEKDLKVQTTAVQELQETVQRLTLERDTALRAQVHAGDHVTRAQNLADILSKRERLITELRQKNLEEQMRITDLEEEVEQLREKVNRQNVDDLKEKLREKSSQCDRFRTQLRETEQQRKLSQSRLSAAMKGGEYLRGGAHIVAPHPKSKLPRMVMSCSECHANNDTCDNEARCRKCVESNKSCARWRCSVQQKLGECDAAPCALPHDSQGWLIMKGHRPEW
jgi:hypothetical protein